MHEKLDFQLCGAGIRARNRSSVSLPCHRKPSISLNNTKKRKKKNKYFGSPLKLDANSKSEKYLCCLRLVLRILDADKSWRRTLSTLTKLKCQTSSDTCPFNCQYSFTSLIHVDAPTHSPGTKNGKMKSLFFFSHFNQTPLRIQHAFVQG